MGAFLLPDKTDSLLKGQQPVGAGPSTCFLDRVCFIAYRSSTHQPPPSPANLPQPTAATDCCSPCSSLPQRSQVRAVGGRQPRWGKYTIPLTVVQPPPQVASYQLLYSDVHRFEVGGWFRERGGSERAGANKQVLHDIACSLMKQRAEPWNLGEAASLCLTLLSPLPPCASAPLLTSSPARIPVSSLQPSRPSSGSPPGSMPACPSPLPTFPRGLSTHPPPLPPLHPTWRAVLYPRLAGRPLPHQDSNISRHFTSTCLTLLTHSSGPGRLRGQHSSS